MTTLEDFYQPGFLRRLLLSPQGRIGRGPFWGGAAVLLCLSAVVHWIPLVGPLLGLALIACWICLFAKRLHDLGLSGWLQAPAHLISLASAVTVLVSVPGRIQGVMGQPVSGFDVEAGRLVTLIFSLATTGYAIGAAAALVFTLVLGIAPGQPRDNRFGPATGSDKPAA